MSHKYGFYGLSPQYYSDKVEADIKSLEEYILDASIKPELQDRVVLAVAEMISCLEELNRDHKAYYKL